MRALRSLGAVLCIPLLLVALLGVCIWDMLGEIASAAKTVWLKWRMEVGSFKRSLARLSQWAATGS